MHPPFTAEQFFDVFRRYNEAVWPAQVALVAVALLALMAAFRANVRRSWRWGQMAIALLAVLWLWSGIAYHKAFFARISASGEIFGSLFIAEAALLLICLSQNVSSFPRASRSITVVGTLLVAYALLVYPAVGHALGHRYPVVPTFGTPCPMTIFTFGIFCLLPSSIPRFAMVIPVLWAVVGSYAAFGFGMVEDVGLIGAAVLAIVLIHHEPHRLLERSSDATA